jgi:hypothetical protein
VLICVIYGHYRISYIACMALDFSIKDNHDRMIIMIPIGLDAFYDIVELSKGNKEFLFTSQKLKDYYEDAEFYISELTILKSQLEDLLTHFHDNRNASEAVFLAIKICGIELHVNKTFIVTAD